MQKQKTSFCFVTMKNLNNKSDILIGVLLGDASLQTYTHGKT
jgi:hypothetical protein